MSEFQPRKYTVSTKLFWIFVVVLLITEIFYFTLTRDHKKVIPPGKQKLVEQEFGPAQANRLKEFLEGTKPEQERVAILEANKIYEIQEGIALNDINNKSKITIKVKGFDKDKKLRATILSTSGAPLMIKKSSKITLQGLQFQHKASGSKPSKETLLVVDGCQDVTIDNCSFLNARKGLEIRYSYSVNVKDVVVKKATSHGLEVEQSESVFINGSTFDGNGNYGIYFKGNPAKKTASGTVQNCTITGSQVGIQVESTSVNVFGCKVLKNKTGIKFLALAEGKIGEKGKANQITDNSDGLHIEESSPQVLHNAVTKNKGRGIVVEKKSRPNISNNQIGDNGGHGVEVTGNSAGQVLDNSITQNGKSGVFVKYKSFPSVQKNQIQNNQRHGIYLSGCGDDVKVTNNQLWQNAGFGIFFEGINRSLREDIESKDNKNDLAKNRLGTFGPSL